MNINLIKYVYQILKAQGASDETAPVDDTATAGQNGRLQRIAQRLSTLITDIGTTNTKLDTANTAADATNTKLDAQKIAIDATNTKLDAIITALNTANSLLTDIYNKP